jgi:hypothetical protein
MKKLIVNNVKIVKIILKIALITFMTATVFASRDSLLKDLNALEPGFITSFYLSVFAIFLAILLILLTGGVWKAIDRINRCSLKEFIGYEELPF